MTKITILCENTVGRPGSLLGEHGFAALIESPVGSWLFDTGQGSGILNNASEMGLNLTGINGIILSHGHNDHTGGLAMLLRHRQSPTDVYGHPEIFNERYWRSEFELRAIGMPGSRDELEGLGARFRLCRESIRLAPMLLTSGEVPRKTSYEVGDPHLVISGEKEGMFVPDLFADDLSLAITTAKGLVILLGCAHAGVINILNHLIELTGETRIHALIGGTHLGPASDEQYTRTVNALKKFRIEKMAVSHCTGLARAAQLHRDLSGQFLFASVGSVFEFV